MPSAVAVAKSLLSSLFSSQKRYGGGLERTTQPDRLLSEIEAVMGLDIVAFCNQVHLCEGWGSWTPAR